MRKVMKIASTGQGAQMPRPSLLRKVGQLELGHRL
jgi:hypothetical protein